MQVTKIDVRDGEFKRNRVYIFPKGETIIENLFNRKTRPYTEFKKHVMPAVLEKLGLPADSKVKWSQYCGCTCPCSPGFIVPGYGKEVYVEVQ